MKPHKEVLRQLTSIGDLLTYFLSTCKAHHRTEIGLWRGRISQPVLLQLGFRDGPVTVLCMEN